MITALLYTALLAAPTADTSVNVNALPVSNRVERPISVAGDIGWNSLGGTGLLVSYDIHPHFSVDAAAGLSGLGPKTGLRARYNLLNGNVTPFVGAGASYAFGLEGMSINSGDASVRYRVDPAFLAQAVVGLHWVASNGFSLLSTVGYTQGIDKGNDDNIRVEQGGALHANQAAAMRAVSGVHGAAVVSIALGYAI